LAINLDALAIHIIVNTIILSPVLWLAGRAVVGREKAKFTDAVLTVVVGTVVGAVLAYFFIGYVAAIIQLILWLVIVRHFFDCGWLKALVISILTLVIFVIIAIILGIIGFAVLSFVL